METPVEYAKTSDGVNIACVTTGEELSDVCSKIGAHNRAKVMADAFRNEIALSS